MSYATSTITYGGSPCPVPQRVTFASTDCVMPIPRRSTTCPPRVINVPITSSDMAVYSDSCCTRQGTPWPVIIVILVGLIAAMLMLFIPNVNGGVRSLGVVLLLIWTLIWALILWYMWKECHTRATWWLLILPVAMAILFVVLVGFFHIGSNT